MPQACKICESRKRWDIENTYLTEDSNAAISLCQAVDISQSAFYRHAKSHMGLQLMDPPENPQALEWSRATINLAKIPEKLITKPEAVKNLSILTEADAKGPFIGLFITFLGDAVDWNFLESLRTQYEVETDSDTVGFSPMFLIAIKLHAPSITVGRRNS